MNVPTPRKIFLTKIADLFRAKVIPSTAKNSQSVNSNFQVEIVKAEKEEGIDEIAVIVTIENKGKSVPGARVNCEFTDEDGHAVETQTRTVGALASGDQASVSFKMVYPKAANTNTYRDYNKNIKYNISVSPP